MKKLVLIGFLLILSPTSLAQQSTSKLDSLRFLVGKWVGEGTGEVGAGSGQSTFEMGLKDKVLIRRNHAEYPATQGRPAVTHDDLMIIYVDPATHEPRAFYTDSEGNTINYAVTVTNGGKSVVFLSDLAEHLRRYRLTYVVAKSDQMTLTFEIATPEKPNDFKRFIEGRIRRVQ